jgi:hypothetical protein
MLTDVCCEIGIAFVGIHYKLKRTHMWKLQTPVRPRPNFIACIDGRISCQDRRCKDKRNIETNVAMGKQ